MAAVLFGCGAKNEAPVETPKAALTALETKRGETQAEFEVRYEWYISEWLAEEMTATNKVKMLETWKDDLEYELFNVEYEEDIEFIKEEEETAELVKSLDNALIEKYKDEFYSVYPNGNFQTSIDNQKFWNNFDWEQDHEKELLWIKHWISEDEYDGYEFLYSWDKEKLYNWYGELEQEILSWFE
jgi:hypothetical protein